MKKVLMLLILSFVVQANEARLKAWTLHNRIAGVPPTPTVLNQMENMIVQNPGKVGLENAASIALQNDYFYNVRLKNWLKPLSNEERSKNVPLNDFVATVIGAIRDSDNPNKPFSRVLYDDLIYVGPALGDQNRNFSRSNNNHYARIESEFLDLKNILVERMQSQNIDTEPNPDNNRRDQTNVVVNGINGAAGVLTTRAYGESFYQAGTNRSVTRHTFMNFLCKDFEDLHDTTVPDFRVRRDVEREPGGDSRTYKNTCVGCHAGQDALGGAFAYWDYRNNRLRFTPGNVVDKMNHNALYDMGHVTTDNSWLNLWASGQNANLGWRGPTTGNGVKEFGQMIARSRQFSRCMSMKVFKLVCIRPPVEDDLPFIEEMADDFESNDSYNMKRLFARTGAHCVEEDI
tara:strand:+ start:252304 stop:253509 length:1206 start_codon:yes stop_codon:yes gene_type:complete